MLPTMKDKIIIVTGSSQGVGLAVAIQLASLGAHLILVYRKITDGIKAITVIMKACPDASVDLMTFDISILSEVHKFVTDVSQKYKKVDVLINTGDIVFNYQNKKTYEGYDATLAANYLGPFVLIHLLLPLLNHSPESRIINVSRTHHYSDINSSELHCIGDGNIVGMFDKSKMALVLFTYHLAKLLQNTNITAIAVNPGLIQNTHTSLFLYIQNCIPIDIWNWKKDPLDGSKVIVDAATDPDLKSVIGKYFSNVVWEDPIPAGKENFVAKKMYDLGCQLCQLDGESMIENIKKAKKIIECEKKHLSRYCSVNK